MKGFKYNLKHYELPLLKWIFRKLRRERAAVFLEFAFALPLLMAISLFILELCLFWDTTIMANHAAFALSRIAKVNCYHGDGTDKSNPYPDVAIGDVTLPADQVVTAFYMMTSTFTWNGPKQSADDIDFIDFFTVNKPLFEVDVSSQTDIFAEVVGTLLKKLVDKADTAARQAINGWIRTELNKVFGGETGKILKTRFNMALQRARQGCTKTTFTQFADSLAFPSDDAGSDIPPGGHYAGPEIVKVSIDYPLTQGGWLYAIFAYWGNKKGGGGDTLQPVALGRYAMLTEPAKRSLEYYHANDSGGSDIDPDNEKKRAEKRAKKIIKETATIVDKWTAAVKKRVNLENQYGGRKKAQNHKDYNDAVSKEIKLWNKITSEVKQFENLVKRDICDAPYRLTCYNVKYFTCAGKQHHDLGYCSKIGKPIKQTADQYNLHCKQHDRPTFPKYVESYYINPYDKKCLEYPFCNN